MEEKDFFSVKEVAEILSVERQTVARMLKAGELQFYRFRRSVRIRREDLLAYLERCKADPSSFHDEEEEETE